MTKIILVFLAFFLSNPTPAATTKVGNGDDGRDLEGLTEITSGVIFSTRDEAIQRLKGLNVQGVQGLGSLIPELENSKMYMASADVSPLEKEGDWETSKNSKVYARTFAEPHSPTRFFPIALTLNKEQLIALHTHEALHRALPPHIREDESKVSMLTLALTSPSATFDRVNRVVQNLIPIENPGDSYPVAEVRSGNTLSLEISTEPSQPSKKSSFEYNFSAFAADNEGAISVQILGAEISPAGVLKAGSRVVEPRLGIEAFLLHNGNEPYAGPVSFNGKGLIRIGSNEYGPLARITLRALEGEVFSFEPVDRDVYTIGGFWNRVTHDSYFNLDLTYTMPSESAKNREYGAIWSADHSTGFIYKKIHYGLRLDFDHMLQKERTPSFSLFQIGPQIQWISDKFSLGLSGGVLLNRRNQFTHSDLGDLVGHGAGERHFSLTATIDI